jgi:hypothetical protein
MRRRRTATNETAESPAPAAETTPRRRGRRPAVAAEDGAAATTSAGATRTRTTRRRRSQAGGETGRLIEALLTSRGAAGATQGEIAQVVGWAQGILAEATALQTETAELRKLGPRSKRTSPIAAARQKQQKEQRQQEIASRVQRHTMDRALLDGVLAREISVDVKDGELVFLSGKYAAEHAGGAATEPVTL